MGEDLKLVWADPEEVAHRYGPLLTDNLLSITLATFGWRKSFHTGKVFFGDNPLFGLKRVASSFMANVVSLNYSDRVTFHFLCFMFRLERTHGQRRPQAGGRHLGRQRNASNRLMNRHAAVVSGGGMLRQQQQQRRCWTRIHTPETAGWADGSI